MNYMSRSRNMLNETDNDRQLGQLIRRVSYLESQNTSAREQQMLDIQQELIYLKNQLGAQNSKSQQINQNDVIDQFNALQQKVQQIEARQNEIDSRYQNKQIRIENTLAELTQKLQNLESCTKNNDILYSENLKQLNQHRQNIEMQQKEIQDNAIDFQKEKQKLVNQIVSVECEQQKHQRELVKMQQQISEKGMEEDFDKLMSFSRDLQLQLQQTNRAFQNFKDQLTQQVNNVQSNILEQSLQYKQKLYQRIKQIDDMEDD